MKILVLGASGQIGQHLLREANKRGHRAIGTFSTYKVPRLHKLNLLDRESTLGLVREVRPDWVFSTAAWAHVDGCEQDPEKARRQNVDVTRHAAEAAADVGARFCYFSSDYVYDGSGYLNTEETPPKPLSVYGRVKLEAERAAQESVPDALIVRTAVVYGPERRAKNSIYQLIRAALAGEPFRVAHDQVCSPTFSPNLAAACIELARQEAVGVLHVAGTDVMSRYDFALLACDIMELDESILRPVATKELGAVAPRPLYNGLDVSKAQSMLKIPLFSAVEGPSSFYKQAPVAMEGIQHPV